MKCVFLQGNFKIIARQKSTFFIYFYENQNIIDIYRQNMEVAFPC